MKQLLLFVLLLLVTVISCKPPVNDNAGKVFEFNPTRDSVYAISVTIRSGTLATDSSFSKSPGETIQFTLQCLQKDNDLRRMKLVIDSVCQITPAMRVTTGLKKDTIAVTGTNTFDTITTNDLVPGPRAIIDSGTLTGTRRLLYHYIKGGSLEIWMNKSGEVLRVNGFDAIVSKVTAATGMDRRLVFRLLDELTGTKAVHDLLAQVFFYLPVKKIQPGNNWVQNFTLTAKAPVKHSNMVTVQAIRGDSVFLAVTTAVTAKTGEGGRVFGQGQRTGTVVASYTSGIIYAYRAQERIIHQTAYATSTRNTIFSADRLFR